MMRGIVDQYGECRKVTHKTEQGIITILTERGNHLTFEMRIDNSMKKLVGLFFHGVKNELNRFRDKANGFVKNLLQKILTSFIKIISLKIFVMPYHIEN